MLQRKVRQRDRATAFSSTSGRPSTIDTDALDGPDCHKTVAKNLVGPGRRSPRPHRGRTAARIVGPGKSTSESREPGREKDRREIFFAHLAPSLIRISA